MVQQETLWIKIQKTTSASQEEAAFDPNLQYQHILVIPFHPP